MKFKDFLKNKGLDETSFASKEANEQGVLMSEFNDIIASKNEEALNALKSKNESLENALKAQGSKLTELESSKANVAETSSLGDSIAKAFLSKNEEYKSASTREQKAPLIIEVNKAAVDMTTANTIGSGSTQYTLTQNTGIISPIRRRDEKYLQSVSVGSLTSPRALWVEETDEQGVPIFIGEGDGKTKLSSLWVEKTAETKKIAVYGKVTTEMIADLPQLISYIQNSLIKRLSNTVESQLLTGNNVGDNLNGAKTLATAFSAGANASSIIAPNEFDVLDALALQVEVANGMANAVYIHPSTWAKMKALKDNTDAPIWKNYIEPMTGDVVYSGMKIITSTAVTAGEFIGGDMTVLNVLFREQLTVQIGLDGNDFTQNKKTILVEQRLVQFASANDTPCLVKGDFDTAKSALELV